MYYYRNRWYDPEIGRFISEDPIGFAGGDVNLYSYVWNSPYSFRDPYGENPLAAFVALLIGAGAHIAFNPSYVNAPAPCRPVIRASDEFSAGEALGAALGMAGGPALGKIAGVVLRGAAGAISKGLGAVGRAIGKGIQKAAKSVTKSKAPVSKSAAEKLVNLKGLSRSKADVALRKAGFEYRGKTSGGYDKYYHPDGSRIQIRPNGEVVRTGPKIQNPDPNLRGHRPRIGPDGKPTNLHNTGEILD